jgi:hypothetical protein
VDGGGGGVAVVQVEVAGFGADGGQGGGFAVGVEAGVVVSQQGGAQSLALVVGVDGEVVQVVVGFGGLG